MIPLRSLIVALLAAALAACASAQRLDAAGDVHALMISIRDNDQAAFDAHVDRQALENELEAKILARTQGRDDVTQALGALLARPLSQLAGATLLQPDVFRAVAEYYGYRPGTPIPGQFEIAGALHPAGDGRVCAARREGPCQLTFANEGGVWRLVSFDGDISQLRLPGLR